MDQNLINEYEKAIDLAVEATDLCDEELGELEKQLRMSPELVHNRVRLLGAYTAKRFKFPEVSDKRIELILWFIENYPDFPFLAQPFALVEPNVDGLDAYNLVRDIWLSKINSESATIGTMLNAASYCILNDKELAEQILLQAKQTHPENPDVEAELENLYRLWRRT